MFFHLRFHIKDKCDKKGTAMKRKNRGNKPHLHNKYHILW